MSKKCTPQLIFSMFVMILGEFTTLAYSQSISLVCVYSWLVIMSMWSLIMTCLESPGYVPLRYEYDENKLSKTAQALIQFC
jgi:hypothetical protein